MLYVTILAVCSAFIAFFLQLELRYFGLFPFFFLLLFFSHGFSDVKIKFSETELIEKYGLYGLFLLISFGILGVLNFIGLSYQSAFFVLLFFCGILWYGSYFLEYNDGKTLFKHGFLFILFLLLGNNTILWGWGNSSEMLGLIFLLAILGFGGLRYGVGSFRSVEKEHFHYFLFFIFLGSLNSIFLIFSTPLYALNIDLLFYCIIMLFLSITSYYSPREESPLKRELSLRRILAGEKILKKEKKRQSFLTSRAILVKEIPQEIKKILEGVNVLLLLGILIAYLLPLFQNHPLQQWRYRSGIGLFLLNTILLKKNQMFSIVSRFAGVVVINFSLYISLLVMGDAIQTMIPWLIARNILCGILIFYTKIPIIKTYIKKTDVIFRLLTSLVAMLLNIVLLMRLAISGQLIFSLIFFYIGIQGTIAYYALQTIKNYNLSESELILGEGGTSERGKGNPLDLLLEKELKL